LKERVSATTVAAYSAPLVPIWMLHTPALYILPGLYATVAGIDLAVLGTILVASRVLDGVTDPLSGIGRIKVRWLRDRSEGTP
jgi:glycoside/pentoside/hexuronide:cation symporter, GPH family